MGSLVDLRFAPTNPVHAFQGRDHVLEWEPIGERIKDALGNENDLGYERQAFYHPARTAIGSARSNQASSLGLTASDLTMQHLQRDSSPANSELHLDLFTPLLSRRRNVGDLRFDSKASFRDDIFHAWVERNDPVPTSGMARIILSAKSECGYVFGQSARHRSARYFGD